MLQPAIYPGKSPTFCDRYLSGQQQAILRVDLDKLFVLHCLEILLLPGVKLPPPLGQGPDGDVRRGAEQVPVVSEHVLHRHPLPGEDSAAEQALLGVTHVLQQTLLHLNPGYDRLAVLVNGFSSGA